MSFKPEPSAKEAPRVIVGLDLLRFAAALLVVVYHLGHRAWAAPLGGSMIRDFIPYSPAYPELEPVAWLGWVGVQIFFVISGFVIANSAERTSPFAFLRSRVIRLAPAIWICATLTLSVYVLVKGLDGGVAKEYIRTVFLPAFPDGPWIDSVYWTLVVEIVFYAIIFALLLTDRFRRIDWLMVVMALSSGGLWVAWGFFGFGEGLLTSKFGLWSLLRHGCFFAIGIALWLLFYKKVTLLRLAMLALAVAGGLFEVRELAEAKVEALGRDLSVLSAQGLFLAGVLTVVLSTLFNRQITAALGASPGVTRSIGMATYPLYLVHNIVGVALLNGLVFVGLGRAVALPVAVASMVAVAWAVSTLGEPLIASVLKKLFKLPEAAGRHRPWLAGLFRSTRPVQA